MTKCCAVISLIYMHPLTPNAFMIILQEMFEASKKNMDEKLKPIIALQSLTPSPTVRMYDDMITKKYRINLVLVQLILYISYTGKNVHKIGCPKSTNG